MDDTNKLMFVLEGTELAKFRAWEAEHNKTCRYYDDGTSPECPSGAIGGQFTFKFTPTGLGYIITIKCLCGKDVNVTDFDNW